MKEELTVAAYVPVIHDGYVRFFEQYKDHPMYVIDTSLLVEVPDIRKDIRALRPEQASEIVEKMNIFSTVALLGKAATHGLSLSENKLIMPRDDVSEHVANTYLNDAEIEFIDVFLRWDRRTAHKKETITPDSTIDISKVDKEIVRELGVQRRKSNDWWRAVSAVLVTQSGERYSAYNAHLPTDYTPHIDGDPRMYGNKGENRGITTAIHAETSAISQAAKVGGSCESSAMYVTTFPCPTCAKTISAAGVNKLYYLGGYAMVDGARVLRDAGVELIYVRGDESFMRDATDNLKPYPEK